MQNAFTYDVFLSHNHADKPQVRRLAERLKAAGVRVWLDEWAIQAGDIIAMKVDEGLEHSRVLLLCISPAALASGWVWLERSTAIHRDPSNAGRRFIPLLLGDCELPDTLRRYKYLDFREESDAAFAMVLASCRPEKESAWPAPPSEVEMVDALRPWKAKLEHLQWQESIVSDPGQKFALTKEIEEAKAKVAELIVSEDCSAREAPAPTVDIAQIGKYAPVELIGREREINILSRAWNRAAEYQEGRPYVLTITGMGGEGKSSLVAKWVALLAHQGWSGCEAVLGWSFYTQGTHNVESVSADLFLRYALAFFGDPTLAAGSPEQKGKRLAELISKRRVLLILDGLEPLQYPPNSTKLGKLRDSGLSELLKGLATRNEGLCVITTRIAVQDLTGLPKAKIAALAGLSTVAGVRLVRRLGVVGSTKLMETLVNDVHAHALTLTLLGSYLKRAHQGRIERRDSVRLEKADLTEQSGHAFRTIEAYENWFLQGGDSGAREVAILRLMGLFDRPADIGSVEVLCSEVIPEINEPLVNLSEDDFSISLVTLENSHLLTVNRDDSGNLISIDAHPLVREYFAGKISQKTRVFAQRLLSKETDDPVQKRDLVYISYSHKDREWHKVIREFLEADIDLREHLWDDTNILAGSDVGREIAAHIAQTKVMIMLASPDYIQPDSGASRSEIRPALKARDKGEMEILWIPVKAHIYSDSPVGHIMSALGAGTAALDTLQEDDKTGALWRFLAEVRRCLGLAVPPTAAKDRRGISKNDNHGLQSALTFSGGGFRATFFHLGVMAFHSRHGSLEKDIKIITSVSGGSILAAHALLHWDELTRSEEGFRQVMGKLVTFARSNIRNKVIIGWLWSLVTGWRFVGKAATRLAKSRTGRLVNEYRAFYELRGLKDLHQPSRPLLVLVSTDLFHSSRVYFSHDGMRRVSIAESKKEKPFPESVQQLDVAFAVAASSSFPPIFRTLALDHKVLKLTWNEFKLEMRLQDGGVHDNLGLRALQLIATDGNISLGVINASYAVNPANIHKPSTGWISELRRALEIFTRGESAEISNDIATLAGAKAVIVKLSDRVPIDHPHLLETDVQTALMSFRTDLDAPSWLEVYALMAHGYEVAAMHAQQLDEADITAARSLFCGILAQGVAAENKSRPEMEMQFVEKIIANLSAEQLDRCSVRPKGRIALHLIVALLLLTAELFCIGKFVSPSIIVFYDKFIRISATKSNPHLDPPREPQSVNVAPTPKDISSIPKQTISSFEKSVYREPKLSESMRNFTMIYQSARSCVKIAIDGIKPFASGAVIGPDFVITARHSVISESTDTKELHILIGDENPPDPNTPFQKLIASVLFTGDPSAQDIRRLDFAILKVEGLRSYLVEHGVTPIPLGIQNIKEEDQFFMVGHHLGDKKQIVTDGKILFPSELSQRQYDQKRQLMKQVAEPSQLKELDGFFDKFYKRFEINQDAIYRFTDSTGGPSIGATGTTWPGFSGAPAIFWHNNQAYIGGILISGSAATSAPSRADIMYHNTILPIKDIVDYLDQQLPNWRTQTEVKFIK